MSWRAPLVGLVALVGCANERGLMVGAGDDPIGAAVGEMLHGELAERPEGARRQGCGDTVDCLAKLRGGVIDIAVVERHELGWLTGGDDLVIAAELDLERRFVLVSSGGGRLAADARVAVAGRFASRAENGLRDLVDVHSVQVSRIDDPTTRADALTIGAIDAAVFEAWRQPINTHIIASVGGSRFAVVARAAVWGRGRDRDAIGQAAGVVATRIEQVGPRLLATIASGIDPVEAVGLLDLEPLSLAVTSEHRAWAPVVDRALATRSIEVVSAPPPSADLALVPIGSPAIPGAELVAVFDGAERVSAELWSKAGLLDRAEALRILEATSTARLPAGDRPSIWRRLTDQTPAPRRGASRWLDTLLNLAVGAFLIWLVVLILGRRRS